MSAINAPLFLVLEQYKAGNITDRGKKGHGISTFLRGCNPVSARRRLCSVQAA
jgi:hypothetical protein